MSARRPANLRNVLSFAAVMVTLLATTAALSLVLATSVLQRMTVDIANSVENVRAIEEAEVALLFHLRATSRAEKDKSAEQVRARLDEAKVYITNAEEATVLGEARTKVDEYFAVARQPDASVEEIRA